MRSASTAAPTLDRIAGRLAAHRTREASRLWKRSAVAVVLRDLQGPEILLMQRAVRAGDRWSGHVSLPGGGEDPSDVDLLATAVRETREEVGIDLAASARLLGRLSPAWAIAGGLPRPMSITPFVFALESPVELTLGAEATAAFWLSFDAAAAGTLDSLHPYRIGPVTRKLPCWSYDGRVIWGLTFEMLNGLLSLTR